MQSGVIDSITRRCPAGRAVDRGERERKRRAEMSGAGLAAALFKLAYYHMHNVSLKMSAWPCALAPVIGGDDMHNKLKFRDFMQRILKQ